MNFLQNRSVDSEESFKTDSSFSQESQQKVVDDLLKPDKIPSANTQPRSSLKKPRQQSSIDEEDDILGMFDDPFKFHGNPKAGAEASKSNNLFKAYQQGDKINRETPSVTFGKGTYGQN